MHCFDSTGGMAVASWTRPDTFCDEVAGDVGPCGIAGPDNESSPWGCRYKRGRVEDGKSIEAFLEKHRILVRNALFLYICNESMLCKARILCGVS